MAKAATASWPSVGRPVGLSPPLPTAKAATKIMICTIITPTPMTKPTASGVRYWICGAGTAGRADSVAHALAIAPEFTYIPEDSSAANVVRKREQHRPNDEEAKIDVLARDRSSKRADLFGPPCRPVPEAGRAIPFVPIATHHIGKLKNEQRHPVVPDDLHLVRKHVGKPGQHFCGSGPSTACNAGETKCRCEPQSTAARVKSLQGGEGGGLAAAANAHLRPK